MLVYRKKFGLKYSEMFAVILGGNIIGDLFLLICIFYSYSEYTLLLCLILFFYFKKKFLGAKTSKASENTFEPKGDYLYTWHVLDAIRFLEEDEKEIFPGNFCENQRTRTEWQGIIINQEYNVVD